MHYPPQHPHQLEPNDDAALADLRDRVGRQLLDDVEGTLTLDAAGLRTVTLPRVTLFGRLLSRVAR